MNNWQFWLIICRYLFSLNLPFVECIVLFTRGLGPPWAPFFSSGCFICILTYWYYNKEKILLKQLLCINSEIVIEHDKVIAFGKSTIFFLLLSESVFQMDETKKDEVMLCSHCAGIIDGRAMKAIIYFLFFRCNYDYFSSTYIIMREVCVLAKLLHTQSVLWVPYGCEDCFHLTDNSLKYT